MPNLSGIVGGGAKAFGGSGVSGGAKAFGGPGVSGGAGNEKSVKIRTRGSRGKSKPEATSSVDYDRLATLVAAKLQSKQSGSPSVSVDKKKSKPSAPNPSSIQAGNGFVTAGGKKGLSQAGNGFAAAAKPKTLLGAAFGQGLLKDKTADELKTIFSSFVGKKTLSLLVDNINSQHSKHFLLAVVQRLLREGKKDRVIAAVVAVFTFNGTYKTDLLGNVGNLGTEVTSILQAIYRGKGLLENCRNEFETVGFNRSKLQQALAATGINTAEQLLAAYVRFA